MEQMKAVTRYQCKFCKKDFKTPDRHHCKMNPALKNCFTCKYLKGWDSDNIYDEYTMMPYPDCVADIDAMNDWTLDSIKSIDYDMQCEMWEEGKFDWSKEGGSVVW